MGGGGCGRLGGCECVGWGGGGVNFTKEIPLNEISENLKNVLKRVRGGQFYKRNPSKIFFRKPQKYAKKSLTEDPILSYTFFKKSRSP